MSNALMLSLSAPPRASQQRRPCVSLRRRTCRDVFLVHSKCLRGSAGVNTLFGGIQDAHRRMRSPRTNSIFSKQARWRLRSLSGRYKKGYSPPVDGRHLILSPRVLSSACVSTHLTAGLTHTLAASFCEACSTSTRSCTDFIL